MDTGETMLEKLYAEDHTSIPSSPASPIFTKKNKQKQVKDLNSDMKGLLIEDISEKDTPIIRKDRKYGYEENEKKKYPEVPINNCSICVLKHLSENITILVSNTELICIKECDGSCIEVLDSLEDFVNAFYGMIGDLHHLKVSSMSRFEKNFSILSQRILNDFGGSYKFYCRVLESFSVLDQPRKDRVVRILNIITKICMIGNVQDLGDYLQNSRAIKRNLVLFLDQTGNINSIFAVLDLLVKLNAGGIEIQYLLPTSMSTVIENLYRVKYPSKSRDYHKQISDAAKLLIQILNEKKIEVLKIYKKTFIPGDQTWEYESQIYFAKEEKCITHFMLFEDNVCSKSVHLDHVEYDKNSLTVQVKDWKFFLVSEWPSYVIQQVDDTSCLDFSDDIHAKEYTIDQLVAMPDHYTASDTSVSDLDDKYKEGLLYEEIKESVIKTQFMIEKNNIMRYWKPVSNEKRKFEANLVASEWPLKYKSVCTVVLKYNRAKKFNSRKRNDPFAKLVGSCTICSATHTFYIQENPFDEIVEDSSVEYVPRKDMHVEITVCGKFFLTNEEPDIEKPVHPKENARGLACKGRERELLGKASIYGNKFSLCKSKCYLHLIYVTP